MQFQTYFFNMELKYRTHESLTLILLDTLFHTRNATEITLNDLILDLQAASETLFVNYW